MAPTGARAENEPSLENPCEMTVLKQRCEIALDIDRDGRTDRAVLVRHPTGSSADLSIYMAAGDEKIDLSRKPAISRKTSQAAPSCSLEPDARKPARRRHGIPDRIADLGRGEFPPRADASGQQVTS